jgi:hypothetical protein
MAPAFTFPGREIKLIQIVSPVFLLTCTILKIIAIVCAVIGFWLAVTIGLMSVNVITNAKVLF